jgi:hypothetical protein
MIELQLNSNIFQGFWGEIGDGMAGRKALDCPEQEKYPPSTSPLPERGEVL